MVVSHRFYFHLARSNKGNLLNKPRWQCRFMAPEKFEGEGETPELAICRAWLKYRQIQKEALNNITEREGEQEQ